MSDFKESTAEQGKLGLHEEKVTRLSVEEVEDLQGAAERGHHATDAYGELLLT